MDWLTPGGCLERDSEPCAITFSDGYIFELASMFLSRTAVTYNRLVPDCLAYMRRGHSVALSIRSALLPSTLLLATLSAMGQAGDVQKLFREARFRWK